MCVVKQRQTGKEKHGNDTRAAKVGVGVCVPKLGHKVITGRRRSEADFTRGRAEAI